jgi:hypothetical protein
MIYFNEICNVVIIILLLINIGVCYSSFIFSDNYKPTPTPKCKPPKPDIE